MQESEAVNFRGDVNLLLQGGVREPWLVLKDMVILRCEALGRTSLRRASPLGLI